MAHVDCRVCGNPVNPAAAECPHCGAAEPASPADPGAETPSAGERVGKTARGIGCVAIATIALVLAVVVAVLAWIF